jgi:hypothetical protein
MFNIVISNIWLLFIQFFRLYDKFQEAVLAFNTQLTKNTISNELLFT